jgi:RNA polymerase sigma-70 factor (ECF subfamily)
MKDDELQRLLEEIRAGKAGAFDRFYEEFGRRLVPFFIRHGLCPRVEDAEDLAQEAIFKIWGFLREGNQRFDSVASLRSYVMMTVRSVAIDWQRRIRRTSLDVPLDDESGLRTLQNLESTSRVHQQIEASQEIRGAIQDLSSNQIRALVLYERDGLTYAEIAQIEGCSVGAVRSRLEEARRKIAKRLAGQHDISEP